MTAQQIVSKTRQVANAAKNNHGDVRNRGTTAGGYAIAIMTAFAYFKGEMEFPAAIANMTGALTFIFGSK